MELIKKSPINYIKHSLFRVKIEGESCWPKLIPGKTYLGTCIFKPRVGDFVVFKNAGQGLLVKEVKAINYQGYIVGGTLSFAKNMRINKNSILGKICLCLN
ncbi:MAG: S24/S26 family peptidase [Candidatus Nealsonbacteria bacterium]|nr:S24/S26 family peptidase [Candidatus Nealsonbacteria bacterium]